MVEATWERRYHGEMPRDTTLYRQAVSLWCWYYVTTEDFDRSICTQRRDGVAYPVTVYERSLCTRFAALQMKTLRRAAESNGIDRVTLETARDVARELSYEKQEGWLALHGNLPSVFAILR